MKISGLVVGFRGEVSPLVEQISAAGPFVVGEVASQWLPVVLETATAAEAERWHDWLRQLDAVEKVDVAFVGHVGEGESNHE